ncbi:collagen-like triple helix repeat-containing protein [Vibrio scophthalmi]|uniref:collagen-like triple helix repeat-containing protein n=1 Tax=Vibrio scophthalmi TaxID=45658 RepID=UPI002FF05C6F
MLCLQRQSWVALVIAGMLSACSGSGSITADNPEEPEDLVSIPNQDGKGDSGDGNTAPQASKNFISQTGRAISQSELVDTLDTITTGSGEVLVSLGDVVSTLGDGLPLGSNSLQFDESYASELVKNSTRATTLSGTTVVKAGEAIEKFDAMPVFVQVNDKTGVFTYTGNSVSDLGGSVEHIGQWLEYHASEQGGLYESTATLSIITAPILVQVGDMLDIKGNGLVIYKHLVNHGRTLPSALYISATHLKQGSRALLVNHDGSVDNLGRIFIGENGMNALLFNEIEHSETWLKAHSSNAIDDISDTLSSSGVKLNGGIYADLGGYVSFVTPSLSDAISINASSIVNARLDAYDLSTPSDKVSSLNNALSSNATNVSSVIGSLSSSISTFTSDHTGQSVGGTEKTKSTIDTAGGVVTSKVGSIGLPAIGL